MFLISNPGKDSLASKRWVVYLYTGGYQTDVGLFAESI
jgi:hypothetical protein